MFAFMILLRFTGHYGPNVLYLNFSATAFQEPCDFKDEPYIKIPNFWFNQWKRLLWFCLLSNRILLRIDYNPSFYWWKSQNIILHKHAFAHIQSHTYVQARTCTHTHARIYLIYPHLPSLPNLGKITLPHMALLSWFWGVLQEWVRNEKVEWVEPIRMSWCPGSHQVPLRLLELWALPWFVCLLFCFLKEHGTPPFFSNRK